VRRCSTRLTVSPRSNLVGVCECGFGHVPSLWGSLPCRTAMYVGSVGHSCLAVLRERQSRVKAEIGNVWKLAVGVRLLCLALFTYIGDGVSARLVSRASFR